MYFFVEATIKVLKFVPQPAAHAPQMYVGQYISWVGVRHGRLCDMILHLRLLFSSLDLGSDASTLPMAPPVVFLHGLKGSHLVDGATGQHVYLTYDVCHFFAQSWLEQKGNVLHCTTTVYNWARHTLTPHTHTTYAHHTHSHSGAQAAFNANTDLSLPMEWVCDPSTGHTLQQRDGIVADRPLDDVVVLGCVKVPVYSKFMATVRRLSRL
jgi:hypothetical protein